MGTRANDRDAEAHSVAHDADVPTAGVDHRYGMAAVFSFPMHIEDKVRWLYGDLTVDDLRSR